MTDKPTRGAGSEAFQIARRSEFSSATSTIWIPTGTSVGGKGNWVDYNYLYDGSELSSIITEVDIAITQKLFLA